MEVVTVRNLPRQVSRRIRRLAAQDRTSINRTVIRLLEERLGSRGQAPGARPSRAAPYHDLDALAGCWTPEEADAFEAVLRPQRAVEPDLWK